NLFPRVSGGNSLAQVARGHDLAIEYTARLLRHTVRHNGPVKRKEINPSCAAPPWRSSRRCSHEHAMKPFRLCVFVATFLLRKPVKRPRTLINTSAEEGT